MIRESLGAGAKNGFMLVSASNGLLYQRRTATDGTSIATSGGGAAAPAWVKLERRGSSFIASWSSDGLTWTTVGTQTISMTAAVFVGVAVTSHNATTSTLATFTDVAVSGSSSPTEPSPLPSGWSAADQGAPAVAGSSAHAAGAFTLRAAGRDIWNRADEFHFAYREGSGDIDAVARVRTITTPDEWAKAGLMVRQALTADAAHATMVISAQRGSAYQRRPTAGALSVSTAAGALSVPL